MNRLPHLAWTTLLCGCLAATAQGVERHPATAPTAPARFLTDDPSAADYAPCFSPDGKTVLFTRSRDHGKTWALYTVPATGGTARRLTGEDLPVSATRPTWSWTTGAIAFTGIGPKGGGSLWCARTDTATPRHVSAAGLSTGGVFYPSWYPDGNRLAVVDAAPGVGGVLKIVDLQRGAAKPLTDAKQVMAGMATVSPDGAWVVFAGQANDGQRYDQTRNRIWVTRGDGGGDAHVLVPHEGRAPSWSPDGRRVAYESLQGSPSEQYAAFVVNADGTGDHRVTDYALDANHPKWSPDGGRWVLSARRAPGTPTHIAVLEGVDRPER